MKKIDGSIPSPTVQMKKEIGYVRQQGKDCVVSIGGKRHIVQHCDANKLGNTLWNRLGPRYTDREMYKLGFISDIS